jgi:hypothetical protein
LGSALEAARFEFAGEISARRIGAAASKEHRFALRIARNETL